MCASELRAVAPSLHVMCRATQGTGRCRLPTSILIDLGVRPGDALVAVAPGFPHAFLCAASPPPRTLDDEAAIIRNGGASITAGEASDSKANVDPSIEIPINSISEASMKILNESALQSGYGRIAALTKTCGTARAVELRCLQGVDPSPWMRVEIGRALARNLVCVGAEVDVQGVGKVRVESVIPRCETTTGK